MSANTVEKLKPTALVTGSSSGIGRAIAIRLARDGFHVLVHYGKNLEGGETTLRSLRSAGHSGDLLSFDVSDNSSLEKSLDTYFKSNENLSLQVLVNNAGTHEDGLAGILSDEAFDRVIKTNLYGSFYLMRWAIKKMIRQRSGSVVNISSLAGQMGNAGQINYSASKAGLIAMTKTLSSEVGSRGIRVNAVAPGLIETEMIQEVPGLEDLKGRIPLKRFGRADEVASVVSFLCSQDASYITGHTISVNGGLYPS